MTEAHFRFPNFKHQQQEWDRHRDDDARALLWQMRTGKSKSTIDVACHRWWKGDIDAMLVIAPNGVHVNWVRRQLPAHMWEGIPYLAHAWQASEAHRQSHQASLDAVMSLRNHDKLAVLAVNSESIIHDKPAALIRRFLKRHGGRVMLVFDEADDFRSPGSKRTKRARSLKRYCRVVRALTGTVVSNSPLAAYSQFELLADGALGFKRFEEFEKEYAEYEERRTRGGRRFQALSQYKNLEDLRDRMAGWSSVVLREDVDDMPKLLVDERTVSLPEAQMKAYRGLLTDYIYELEAGGEIEAIDAGVRMLKLQQIVSGFAVDSEGNLREIVPDEQNPKLIAMLDEVRSSRKAIVWCKFREDIRRVVRTLNAEGIKCVEYHGAIHSQAKRQAAIDAFNGDDSVGVFVGQPKAGGRGLDLSAADLIVWYSHTSDAIEKEQADERATQIGGKHITIKNFVTPGTVEETILEMLAEKRSVSDMLAGRGLRDRLLALFRSQL